MFKKKSQKLAESEVGGEDGESAGVELLLFTALGKLEDKEHEERRAEDDEVKEREASVGLKRWEVRDSGEENEEGEGILNEGDESDDLFKSVAVAVSLVLLTIAKEEDEWKDNEEDS